MFLTVKHHFSETFLVSIFALFVSFSTRCFTVLLVLRSISDCAPISMFVSIHSTSSSLRVRGFDTRHPSQFTSRHECSASTRCQLDAAVRHFKCILHRQNLVLYLCNLFLFDLNLHATSSKISVALPRQLHHVVLCVLGYTTASQDSCRPWLAMLPVASLRPVLNRLAQTG